MKRRTFIREIVLLSAAPLLWLPRKSKAQPGWSPGDLSELQPPPSSGGAATLFASNTDITTTTNNVTNFSVISQFIACSQSLSITKVLIYQHSAEGTGNLFVRIRSAVNNGGTLHGTSDTVLNNTSGWRTLNFGTPAAVSADFYITVVTSAGAGYGAFRMSGSGTLYSTTTYDAFSGTTDQNQDLAFECWGT